LSENSFADWTSPVDKRADSGIFPFNGQLAERLNAPLLKTKVVAAKLAIFQKDKLEKSTCVPTTGPPFAWHHANRTLVSGHISPLC